MQTFGGIEPQYAQIENAKILLQSIPYDGTSTWGKGADKGFAAFLEAAENMELYDIETDSEVYREGIAILPAIEEATSPKAVFRAVYESTQSLLQKDKFLTFFGGEHAISIGIIKAFYEAHPEISILHLDAHADLRPSYLSSPFNHACALYDAVQHCNVVHVGIRSMDKAENKYLNRTQCFFAHEMQNQTDWMQKSLDCLGDKVYITLDLDVLDPSIMPSTGTPEPGGMTWYALMNYLQRVFASKNVLGFDIVELAPIEGLKAPNFLAAKLYYKMLSYKFYG